jgi:N-acetylglutamate synthase-like GNAT family acetyltransferase
MSAPALKIRRGRRGDFAPVMRLLGVEDRPADRRTLRRFRHIVADLGADLYVAELGGRVVGVIHATYARQLAGAQTGRIERVAADPVHRDREVERHLLDFIVARARKRECAALTCVPPTSAATALARDAGFAPGLPEHTRPLAGEA